MKVIPETYLMKVIPETRRSTIFDIYIFVSIII
jgi:hypothetical protein